jgi:hypothetical protein
MHDRISLGASTPQNSDIESLWRMPLDLVGYGPTLYEFAPSLHQDLGG